MSQIPVANQPRAGFKLFKILSLYQFWMILLAIMLISSLFANLIIALDANNNLIASNKSRNEAVASRNFQKLQKDKIRNLWELQAFQNDQLVTKQEDVIRKTQSYTEELSRTLRFVNNDGQIIKDTINQRALEVSETNMIEAISELDALIEKNSVLKENNKREIDALYLVAGEDQPNKLNPDGIRS